MKNDKIKPQRKQRKKRNERKRKRGKYQETQNEEMQTKKRYKNGRRKENNAQKEGRMGRRKGKGKTGKIKDEREWSEDMQIQNRRLKKQCVGGEGERMKAGEGEYKVSLNILLPLNAKEYQIINARNTRCL